MICNLIEYYRRGAGLILSGWHMCGTNRLSSFLSLLIHRLVCLLVSCSYAFFLSFCRSFFFFLSIYFPWLPSSLPPSQPLPFALYPAARCDGDTVFFFFNDAHTMCRRKRERRLWREEEEGVVGFSEKKKKKRVCM